MKNLIPRSGFVIRMLGCWLVTMASVAAQQQHSASGLLLKTDPVQQVVIISCDKIPGYMDAMVMSFRVSDAKTLIGLKPGMMVDFTIVHQANTPFADNIHIRPFENLELDPTQAKRLKALERALEPSSNAVAIGQPVPDFALIDQDSHRIARSQFDGKVVAITFIYTRCPFPSYCVRLSDNFARLQKRFRNELGRNLVLLTVVIDAVHDQPETLAKYSQMWKADPVGWFFLTGSSAQIQSVCQYFDMNYYPDEALYIHSFHTAVIDRKGRLAANLEGNDFSARALGDLVQTVMQER
jgi:protein SCO1/2